MTKYFIKMQIKNFNEINYKILNILFFIFPISFLIGNAVLNLTIISISLIGTISLYDKFNLLNKKITFIATSFFILIILFTYLANIKDLHNEQFFKSLKYLRYLPFFLITSIFINVGKFNFRYFLISVTISVLLLSFDIIFQFFFGVNIFGFKAYEYSQYHLSGFLKEELIAGGYIQRFCFFVLLFYPILFTKKIKIKNSYIFIFLSVIFFTSILFSGNRMPLIMFLLTLFLFFLFIKKIRYQIIVSILLSIMIFFSSIKSQENLKNYYISFFDNIVSASNFLSSNFKNKYPELEKEKIFFDKKLLKEDGTVNQKIKKKYNVMVFGSGHSAIYLTAIELWTEKPFIGSGIKSFKTRCKTKLHLPNRACESHPHNYYLDILNDVGIIGTLLFIYLIFSILKNKISTLKKLSMKENVFIFCFLVLILVELFPIRSSGSFFGSSNSSFLFFLLAIINGYKKKKNLKLY